MAWMDWQALALKMSPDSEFVATAAPPSVSVEKEPTKKVSVRLPLIHSLSGLLAQDCCARLLLCCLTGLLCQAAAVLPDAAGVPPSNCCCS